MITIRTAAILLRAVDFGEADKVVTLLGRDTGRVSALARGARRSRKRFAAGLGFCAVGEATLRERAGAELMILEQFDPGRTFSSLPSDVARMAHAAYAVELVGKLCGSRQPELAVYDWLEELLDRLDKKGASAERLRVFEVGLLRRLGLGPAIAACVVCGRSDFAGADSRWDPGRGGTVCRDCGAYGRPMRADVRDALARLGDLSLVDGEATRLPPDVNVGAREAIFEFLKEHLSGPLRSLEFIEKMAAVRRDT